MRISLFAAAVAAFLTTALAANPAQAITLAAPTGLSAAADALSVTEKVYYGYGWGYRRPYYGYGYYRPWRPYYGGYYRPYRPYYGYRPYYRPYYSYYRPYYPYYRPYRAYYGPRYWGGYGGYRPWRARYWY